MCRAETWQVLAWQQEGLCGTACEPRDDPGMPLGICSSHAGVLGLPRTSVHNCLCCPKHLMLCADSTWVITASLSPGIGLADMLLGCCSRLCAHWILGGPNVLVGTGTCTDEAKYTLEILSAITKEPAAVLMLTCCFSTSSEIFRGSSYLGDRTNTIIKTAKKTPKTMKWREWKLQNVN